MTLDNDWVWHPIRSVILLPSPTPPCRHWVPPPSVCNLLQDPGGNQSSNAAVAARSQSQSPRLCNVVYSKRYVWLFGSAIQVRTAAMTDTYLLTQQRVKQQVFKQVAFINHSNWRKVEPELWHAARRGGGASFVRRLMCYGRRRRRRSLTEPCSWI